MATETEAAAGVWGQPTLTGAAFDFRSDVVTTPSIGMLNAIRRTTLNDDVYGEDQTTSDFESEMAAICGKEAAAFVITGTMANQLALRTLLNEAPPYGILTDAQSHIVHWEAGGAAFINGAMIQAIRPLNGRYLTVRDAEKHAVLAYDVHKTPTRVVSIENTNSGTVIPLEELQRLKDWARRNEVSVHIDGARMFDAVAASGTSLHDFAQCADLITLDFSKNLGAPMGAMVLGSVDAIRRLKRTRKGLGGGMRQAGVLAAAARQAMIENFGSGGIDTVGTLARSHDIARLVGQLWTERGGRLLRRVETNMIWVDLKALGIHEKDWNAAGKRHGIRLDGRRIMFHHQICDQAVMQLQSVINEVLSKEAKSIAHSTWIEAGIRARL
ncbi:beta-eliminating lyase [Diaporthe amygdali]|uniref:beta-eliminating lyase n=1 Tax=Phomopsis amygdali TaxID=1214568 RepID=UPI0022FE9335|nr:beta-eliminating lyase [Diaporthe amygdali]KAJ0107704.1 beta-eliminating lyase [Diaporthe amygdali]